MISISYTFLASMITMLWILVRWTVYKKSGTFRWQRELQLLLVYICIVVVVRFTFHPFGKVNGRLLPLVFDASNCFPPRINLIPFVNLLDYPEKREMLLNLVGNTAMFVPLGVVWPSVFKQLDNHGKVIAAGVGCSLLIELLQLPFYDRVSDIDDLILNALGFLIGYGIYLLMKTVKKAIK